MKQLFLFVVLLIVVGIAGFLYRATVEAPLHNTNIASTTDGGVCQADAKVCPDGTSVGRSGPSCQFAACPLPNVELPQLGISFVLPAGFGTAAAAPGGSLIASYEKSMAANPKDTITVRRYAIPEGKDANAVMLAETTYATSGMQPESMQDFTPVIINGKTFQMITVERFEAQVHVVYYLPRAKDVLRFEALQHDVTDWTDPNLDERTLAVPQALETMLASLKP